MTTRQRRFAGRTALVTGSSRGLGLLDVLVNNAGIIQVGPLDALREEDFRQAMETMYFAPLRLTLAAPPDLRASEAGTALTLSSVGGRIPAPRLLPYVAAEFAAAGFSQGLRAELAGTGVSVTTVLPGLVRTGSHTAARFHGRPGAEYGWFATAASSRSSRWTPNGPPAQSSGPRSGADPNWSSPLRRSSVSACRGSCPPRRRGCSASSPGHCPPPAPGRATTSVPAAHRTRPPRLTTGATGHPRTEGRGRAARSRVGR